jgi:hypothetical protein
LIVEVLSSRTEAFGEKFEDYQQLEPLEAYVCSARYAGGTELEFYIKLCAITESIQISENVKNTEHNNGHYAI